MKINKKILYLKHNKSFSSFYKQNVSLLNTFITTFQIVIYNSIYNLEDFFFSKNYSFFEREEFD